MSRLDKVLSPLEVRLPLQVDFAFIRTERSHSADMIPTDRDDLIRRVQAWHSGIEAADTDITWTEYIRGIVYAGANLAVLGDGPGAYP
jgi:hypothetical protein